MWWKRKPVTHAAALWTLVVVAAALLGALFGYIAVLTDLKKGIPRVFPPKRPAAEAPPSLFGTVCATLADGTIIVASKQPFAAVVVDENTAITSVGGGTLGLSDIAVKALITATGKDIGNRRLLAEAVAVVEKDGARRDDACASLDPGDAGQVE